MKTQIALVLNRGRSDRIPIHNRERQAAFRSIWRMINDNV
jgi:hypothetical protein